MNIESLITDLAFILLLGAIVTILFKWLKQPVVLGYIVAGFLVSPHFEYLPSVNTEANIEFWAQIGIIVLLFSLGLEFSFKKLVNTGASAVVTALIIVCGMMGFGYVIGRFLGFTNINALFLGGMLSMSSTTIIIKAFNDLGLRQRKFTSLVLAVLIIEDLFAVVMMVVLSSIAVNNSVEGSEMLFSVAKLIFFLVMWFLVGVFVLPTLFNKWRRFLNQETLLVVSMGLCLGMSVFSVYCGFSLALGAFVMGSILAGTSYAESIEHVTMPVKDLFGAVFFISVGMMVQPHVLAQYWWPILLLSLVVIFGMIVFGTLGMLVTGQSLRVAIESGFSLTQIGEFAFIIATLGMSLGVLNPEIYPIVVAVSVITTFTTPYFIRMADPFYDWLERHLPRRLSFLITRYRSQASRQSANTGFWGNVLKRYLWRTLIYCIVLIAISILSQRFLKPWLKEFLPGWYSLLFVSITLVAMAPFLLALILPPSRSTLQKSPSRLSLAPRIVMQIFRVGIAVLLTLQVISAAYSIKVGMGVGIAVLLIIGMLLSSRLRKNMARIETKFMDNLNERELRRSGKNNNIVGELHLAYITVGTGCKFAGERLRESNLRQKFGVNVVSVQRNQRTIQIPDGNTRVFPGDSLGVIGTDEQLQRLLPVVEANEPLSQTIEVDVQLQPIELSDNSPLVGKTPQSTSLRNKYEMLVVAVQRGDNYIDSDPSLVFQSGDIVWAVGSKANLQKIR